MNKAIKALLGVGVTMCMIVAGHKVYDFYKAHQPLAEVGECLLIVDPRIGALELKITANDNWKAVSQGVVQIDIAPGMQVAVPVEATYEELRAVNATKVECQ